MIFPPNPAFDFTASQAAGNRQKVLTKPAGSLGRLGERTGAVLAFHIIEVATRLFDEMATFSEAGVTDKS